MTGLSRSRRRRGASLVEVLVVVSILSLLFALLMPAVQSARAAAARMSCQSNLRQIALATHGYESAHGQLPPAFRHRRTDPETPNLQWPLLIAPHLELEANWRTAVDDFRRDRDAIFPTPHRGLSVPLKPFSCPSDPRTAVSWEITFIYTLARPHPAPVTRSFALTSYLGNGGAFSARRDGAIVADGTVTLVHVTDGTSNTLAFGERPPPKNLMLGWVYYGWGAHANGVGELSSVMGVNDLNPFVRRLPESSCGPGPFPYQQPDLNSEADCAFFQYWSLHSGGANFAFCDGSVRFLGYRANSVLAALATRAGGEVAAPE